jgi:DNA-binding response OmpR family regulator
MANMVKQLRKFEKLSLLVITKDVKFYNELKKTFSSVKELKIVNNSEQAIQLCQTTNFDILLMDTMSNSFTNSFTNISKVSNIPLKIIVLNTCSDQDILDAVNSNINTIFTKPFSMNNLKLSIIMALNTNERSDKIKLGQGFYFDIYRDRAYNRYGKVVNLTKLEIKLLKLIIKNQGNIVDYKLIEDTVWAGKKMSIFTMRNVISKIRTKMYYDVFKNASSKGYILE